MSELDLELEPPARCETCGRSIYLADRDDDSLCDECWGNAEKIKQEDYEREVRERARRGVPSL